MKEIEELLAMSNMAPVQLSKLSPKQFGETKEYKEWKKDIVNRRLKKLDQLLSTGEWISNSRMLTEINELYLDAPNAECYGSLTPPHRIVEDKEGSRKQFMSSLSLAFSGTIRQDRMTIYKILRFAGKEHILEKMDGDGTEGSYRYNTEYSIFKRFTINDIDFNDYELSKRIPIVLNTIKSELKTEEEKDSYLIDVANDVGDLTISTLSSINLLSALSQARRRAQVLINSQIGILIDRGYEVCLAKKDGWEKECYSISKNIYYMASHPDADVDIESLFHYRFGFAFLRIFHEPDYVVLEVMRKAQEDLLKPELVSLAPIYNSDILAVIKHFVFELMDYDGMVQELERHYQECVVSNTIIEDYGLMEAMHSFIYQDLFINWEKHQPHGRLFQCLSILSDLYSACGEKNQYISWMLLLFDFTKRFSGVLDEIVTSSRSEVIKVNYELLSAIGQTSISKLMQDNAHKAKYLQMVIDLDLDKKSETVEYMVLTEMVSDMFDFIAELILAKEDDDVEPLHTQMTLSLFEMLLSRISKLDLTDIDLDCPADSPLLKCNFALAMIHDVMDNDKEALLYFRAAEGVYEKEKVDLPELMEFVSHRIDVLSHNTN
jgi:hypothetical protein